MNSGMWKGFMFKKSLSALMAVCLLFAYIPAAEAGSLGPPMTAELTSAAGVQGDTVTMSVYMEPDESGDHSFYAYSVELNYDPQSLEPLSVADIAEFDTDSLLDFFTPDISNTTGGTIQVNAQAVGLITERQEMFSVTFKIKDNAAPGDSEVTIASASYTSIADPENVLDENITNGKVTITAKPDTAAPTLAGKTDSAALPVGDNLQLTFSEAVTAVADKNIVIRKVSDDSIAVTVDVYDTNRVTIAGPIVTIDPADDLDYDTAYYAQIDAGAFADGAGNPFAGIADKTSWTFATEKAAVPGTITVGIGSASGKAGDTVEVPVAISQTSTPAGSYGMQIDFDHTALEVVSIDGASSGDLFMSVFDNEQGSLKTAWADASGGDHALGAGVLFKVKFKIKSGAAAGDKPLTVAVGDVSTFTFTDANALEMEKTLIAGKVTVEAADPTPTPTPASSSPVATVDTGVVVLVNGKPENAGTAASSIVNGQTVTTVVIDQAKLDQRLAAAGRNAVITIPLTMKSDVVIAELNGQMVKNMEDKEAILEVKTGNAVYTLPALQIDIQSISDKLGKDVALKDIKIQIEIATPTAETMDTVNKAAKDGNFTIVAPPLSFTVRAVFGDDVIDVSRFNAYVKRTIAIPDGVDPSDITTGVVVDPDGTVRHVPTKVVVIDGVTYAEVNSLTNSTYTIVWHPIEFADAAAHWAKDAVNDMGSRMVVSGDDRGDFNPDQAITRAEFAAIIVRGLGLKPENGTSPFSDASDTQWYSGAVQTAFAYKLINGFEDGSFRPGDKITREQAMTIIAKAMAITGLQASPSPGAARDWLSPFADAAKASAWAKPNIADCLQAGIVNGRNSAELAPQADVTRAETAVMVRRLLQKSGLIQ